MAKTKTITAQYLVFGVLLLAAVFVGSQLMTTTGPTYPQTPVPSGGLQVYECSSETTPDVNIRTYDLENVGTAMSDTTNVYRKVGDNTWDAFTAGTAETNLEFGETYEYIIGVSTTDFIDNAYGPVGTFTVKCQESEVLEVGVYNDDIETEISATFYNEDHVASTAQAISTSESKTISLKWEASVDEVYGNPFIATSGLPNLGAHRVAYPNMLQLAMNSTEIEDIEFVKVSGVTMNKIACGTNVTATTGFTNFCYESPVVTEDAFEFDVKITAKAVDPAQDGTAYIYASNFYVNSDTGVIAWGIENEDGAGIGAHTYDSVTVDLS